MLPPCITLREQVRRVFKEKGRTGCTVVVNMVFSKKASFWAVKSLIASILFTISYIQKILESVLLWHHALDMFSLDFLDRLHHIRACVLQEWRIRSVSRTTIWTKEQEEIRHLLGTKGEVCFWDVILP